jgi:excisionase family DNA binding protein
VTTGADGAFAREAITRLAAEADADTLPALVGVLAEAQALALARLTTRTSEHPALLDDRLLTMPEVADRLAVTEHQAREMGRRGELPTVTVGERFVRVRASALDEWIRRRENGRSIREGGGR